MCTHTTTTTTTIYRRYSGTITIVYITLLIKICFQQNEICRRDWSLFFTFFLMWISRSCSIANIVTKAKAWIHFFVLKEEEKNTPLIVEWNLGPFEHVSHRIDIVFIFWLMLSWNDCALIIVSKTKQTRERKKKTQKRKRNLQSENNN